MAALSASKRTAPGEGRSAMLRHCLVRGAKALGEGRPEDAEASFRSAAHHAELVQDEGWSARDARRGLGRALEAQGLLQEAIDIYEQLLPADGCDAIAAMEDLARVWLRQGRRAAVVRQSNALRPIRDRLLRDARTWSDKLEGMLIVLELYGLAGYYVTVGDDVEAIALYCRAVDILERIGVPEDLALARIRKRLATLEVRRRDLDRSGAARALDRWEDEGGSTLGLP